jgi:uncharacterized protein YdhG (YjbR/CyaY superfamily)
VRSEAEGVDSYLVEVPENRREALSKMRQLCLENLAGYEETMAYGMPSYSKDGVVEVAFASQKNYISFYVLKKEVLDRHRHLLAGLNVGKGCIRYATPKKIDYDVVAKLLQENYSSDGEIC